MVFRKLIENLKINSCFLSWIRSTLEIHYVNLHHLHHQFLQNQLSPHLILSDISLKTLSHLPDNCQVFQYYYYLNSFAKILFDHFCSIVQLAKLIFSCLIIFIKHLLIENPQIYLLLVENFDIDQLNVRNWFSIQRFS